MVNRFISKDWDRAPVRVEKIADLIFDWSLYPRKEIDHQNVVRNYARALEAGCVFPSIKVGVLAEKKVIVDGVRCETFGEKRLAFTVTVDHESGLTVEGGKLPHGFPPHQPLYTKG